MGKDCISPSNHSVFSTPIELIGFIGEMRRLSGGKPAGIKLCIGDPWEFLAICKAMLMTNVYPEFIVIDGREGGTGTAPLEFVDHRSGTGSPSRTMPSSGSVSAIGSKSARAERSPVSLFGCGPSNINFIPSNARASGC